MPLLFSDIDSSTYISTKEASDLSGYNPDYLSRLCRSGSLVGKQVGRAWFIERASLEAFSERQRNRKEELRTQIAEEREREYRAARTSVETPAPLTWEDFVRTRGIARRSPARLRSPLVAAAVSLIVVAGSAYASTSPALRAALASTPTVFQQIARVGAIAPVGMAAFGREDGEETSHASLALHLSLPTPRQVAHGVSFALGAPAIADVARSAEERAVRTQGVLAASGAVRINALVARAQDPWGTLIAAGVGAIDTYIRVGRGFVSAVAAFNDGYLGTILAAGSGALDGAATSRDAARAVAGYPNALLDAYASGVYAYALYAPEIGDQALARTILLGDRLAVAAASVPNRIAVATNVVVASLADGAIALLDRGFGRPVALYPAAVTNPVADVPQLAIDAATGDSFEASVLGVLGTAAVRLDETRDALLAMPNRAADSLSASVVAVAPVGWQRGLTALFDTALAGLRDAVSVGFRSVASLLGLPGFVPDLAVIPFGPDEQLAPPTQTDLAIGTGGMAITNWSGSQTIIQQFFPQTIVAGPTDAYILELVAPLIHRNVGALAGRGGGGGSGSGGGGVAADGATLSNVTITSGTAVFSSANITSLTVGTTTVTGDLTVGGTLTVAGLTLQGPIVAPYFTATSTTQASDFPLLTSATATIAALIGTNATFTNATSTNFFATAARFTDVIVDTLLTATTAAIGTVNATVANLTTAVITDLTATNATLTNATSTNATSTNLYALNARFGTATTTSLFTTTLGLGGQSFTSLLGTGLVNVGGTLTVSTSSFSGAGSNFNADLLDGLDSTYFLANSFSTTSAGAWLATRSTSDLAEGTNLYFTDARARNALSVGGSGLAYDALTGVFSVASGFGIPLTASTTAWQSFYDAPSTRITAGTNLSWSGNTLNGLSNADIRGLLSATYPIQYNSGTGVFSLAFGTTTSNTWAGTQTFTNAPVLGSLTGLIYGNNGVLNTAATSSATLGLGLTGTLTTVGTGQSLTIATSSLFTGTMGQVPVFTGTNALAGTSTLFIASNGNVGVGSTSPGLPLSVGGNAFIAGSLETTDSIQISRSSGSLVTGVLMTNAIAAAGAGSNLSFRNALTLAGQTGVAVEAGGIANTYMYFSGRIGSQFTEFARFSGLAGGAFGVGTTSPWGQISASSTSANPGLAIQQLGSGPAAVFLGGNVGIGTTSPFARLSVAGGAVVTGTTTTGGLSIGALSGFLRATGGEVSTGLINLASDVTGTLPQANGGTGFSSFTAGDILYADTNGDLARLPIGSAGQVLKVQAGLPFWGLDQTIGGGGSDGIWATSTNRIHPVDTSNVVLVGNNVTTTPNSIFEVSGQAFISTRLGIATTSPFARLSVNGDAYIAGALTATGTVSFTNLGSGLIASNNGRLYSFATSTNLVTSLTAGTGITLSGNTGAITVTNDGVLSIAPQFGSAATGTITLATSTTGTDFSITGSGATLTLNLPSASASARGLLTATDWSTFNSKENALTFTYPLQRSVNTITLAFGTTTSNTWAGTQTFTNAPVLGSLTGLIYGNNGVLNTAATSSATLGLGLTGTLIGVGAGQSLTLATSSLFTGTLGQVPVFTGTNALAGTSTLFIASSGNVGVGTTTPSARLSVSGTASVLATSTNAFSVSEGDGDPVLIVDTNTNSDRGTRVTVTRNQLEFTTAGVDFEIGNAIGGGLEAYLNVRNSRDLQFQRNGSSVAVISGSNGFFGLGTTSPFARLSVAGDTFLGGTLTATGTVSFTALGSGLVGSNGGVLYSLATSTNFVTSLTAGSGITLSGSTGAVTVSNAGLLSLQQSFGSAQTGAITLATSTTGTDFSITNSGATFTFNLPSASATNRGLLTSADWTTFNSKISSTSLSATYPVQYNSGTGVFTLAFGTTTSNTWAGTQTFTNAPVLGSLTGLIYGNNGVLNTAATSSLAVSSAFSYSGALGSLVGGTGGTLSLATNGVALTNIAQIAANTILGNPTGTTGNVQAIATSSLGIALVDTTGVLAVTRGGTGTSTAPTFGQLLMGNGLGGYSLVATSSLGIEASGITGVLAIAQGGTNASSQTANGIAFFNGTSITTGSTFTFDGSNVTLGSGIMNAPRFRASDSEGLPGFSWQGDTTTGMYRAGANLIGFSTGGVGRVFIDGNGFLGIGTSAPSTNLSIEGNALVNGGLTANALTVGSLSGVLYGNSGAVAAAATSTPTLGLGLSYSGTLGAFVGGTSGALTIATSSLFTGTTGQVPFFNGTNSLVGTSSLFIASNGNVGVGSTSPWARFSINPDASIGAGPMFAIGSTTGPQFYINNAGRAFIGSAFGTPVAGVSLTLEGSSGNPNSAAANGSFFVGNAGGNTGISIGVLNGNYGWIQARHRGSASFNDLSLNPLGGNIGIGTTSPFARLSVAGDAFIGGNLTATGTVSFTGLGSGVVGSNAGTLFSTATSSATLGLGLTGTLTTLGASDSLTIATSSLFTGTTGQVPFFNGTNSLVGTSSLFIASNGNVGVGTTTPIQRFSVEGASRFDGQLQVRSGPGSLTIDPNGVVTSDLNLSSTNGSGITGTRSQISVTGSSNSGFSSGVLGAVTRTTGTAAANAGSRIAGIRGTATFSGGIANNMPISYGVYGQVVNSGAGSTTDAFSIFGDTPSVTSGAIINAYAGGFAGRVWVRDELGVGTTSPWAQLSASSTSANPALAIQQQGSGAAAVFLGGNVGIATSTPGSLLSIGGVANFTTATSTFSSTGGINLTGGCFAVNGVCVGNNNGTVTSIDASGGTTGLTFSGGPITSSGTLTLGGTLGIANGGTNASSQTANGIAFFNGTSITTGSTFTFDGSNVTLGSGIMNAPRFRASDSEGLPGFSWQGDTTTGMYRAGANLIGFSTGGVGRVFIDGNGFLGIGTSAPSTNLSVEGGALISGTATATNLTALGTLRVGVLNGPLQANNGVVSATSSIGVLYGGTGLTTAPTFGQLLVGNSSGGYTLTATSSLGLVSAAIQNLGPAGQLQSGPSITLASSSATFNGLTTGVTITGSGNTLTFQPTLSGTLNNSGLTNSSITVALGTSGTDANVSGSPVALGSTLTLNLPSASALNRGLLTATDWSTFNSKENALTFTYPLQRSVNTITLAFGTTTSNTWAGTQTFTNAPVLGSLTGLIYGNNGVLNTAATSSATLGLGLTGSLVGVGAGQSLTIATSSLFTGTTGQVPFFTGTNSLVGTSSLFVATSGQVGVGTTTPIGTLSVVGVPAGGGPALSVQGFASSPIFDWYSSSGVLLGRFDRFGNLGIGTTSPFARLSVAGNAFIGGTLTATGTVSFTALGSGLVGSNGGVLYSLATSTNFITSLTAGSGITLSGSTGAVTVSNAGILSLQTSAGSPQTGAITLATSTAATASGITVSTNITNSGGTFTFVPQISVANIPNAALQNSSITFALGTSGTDANVSGSPVALGSTLTLNLPSASATNRGLLTSADWTTFNSKISSTSLSATYPVQYNSSTGVFSLAFGTTTANTWGATQTFTNAPVLSSLSAGTVNVAAGGTLYSTATSTPNLGLGLSYSGALGSFIGGTSGALTIATSSLFTGTAGQVPVFTGTNALAGTSTLFIASNGNVGVGSTTPFAPLSVNGAVRGTSFGDATSNAALSFGSGNVSLVATGGGTLTWNGGAFFPTADALRSLGSGTNRFQNAFLSGSLFVGSAAGDRFLVDSATGSVGIGTTSPFARLSVAGDAFIGGTLTATGTVSFTALGSGLVNATNGTLSTVATSSLGLVTSVNASGGTTGLSFTGGPITTSGTLTLSGTLGVANGGTGSTTLTGILVGNGTSAVQTASISAPLQLSGSTLSITQANSSTNGFLSSADWTTFNSKISSTSLSATFPLTYNSGTGVFTLAFGTTTANTWSALQTFAGGINVTGNTTLANATSTNDFTGRQTANTAAFGQTGSTTISATGALTTPSLTVGSLSGVLFGNSGAVASVATSTPTLGLGLSYSGTLGAFVGGSAGSLTIATSSLFTGTLGQVPFFNGTNSLVGTSSLFIASNGNVGVGSTSPSRRFSVTGPVLMQSGASFISLDSSAARIQTTSDISLSSDFVSIFGNSGLVLNGGSSVVEVQSDADFSGRIFLAGVGSNRFTIGSTTAWGLISVDSAGIVPSGDRILAIGSSTDSYFLVDGAGRVGIATSTPGSLLSIGGVANFTTATSTFSSTGGINLTGGCFAINGVCVGGGTSGVTSLTPQFGSALTGAVTIATSTTGTDFSITGSGATLTLNLPSASALNRGLLTATDWSTFNSKENALTFTYPLQRSVNTITLAFGTTTSNTWAGTQTFTNAPVLGSLTGLIYGNNGVLNTAATSSATLGLGLTGTLIGVGAGQSLTLATSSLFTGTTGQVPVFDGTNSLVGTSSLFMSPEGRIGVGSTSPWAQFSINPEAAIGTNPMFAIGSSSATRFIVTSAGRVGIGIANPTQSLTVDGSIFAVRTSRIGFIGDTVSQGVRAGLSSNSLNDLILNSGSAVEAIRILGSNGFVGIGTTSPWAQLSASSTSANPALAIQQQGSGAAAVFLGGNVGIATSTPGSLLSIGGVANFTTATSTFSSTGGINLTGGCFAINGVCVGGGTSGVTSLTPQFGSALTGAVTIATSTTGTDFSITGSGATLTLNLPSASASARGLLTATDWSTFNSKENALTFTYPLQRSVNTITLAFGTTTSNTWAGTQTFTNAPVLGSLTGLIYGNNGVLNTAATSSATLGLGLTGTLTTVGAGQSLTLATSSLFTGTLGQVPVFTGTNALAGTSTLFIASNGNVGVGTTTPWAQFSIDPTSMTGTNPILAIGSSTGNQFYINNAGRVFIGVTPGGTPVSGAPITIEGLSTAVNSSAANGTIFLGNNAGNTGISIGALNGAYAWLQARNRGSASFNDLSLNPLGGNIGIGTTSPFARLSVAGDAFIGGNLTATGTVSFTGLGSGVVGSNAGTLFSAATSTPTLGLGLSYSGTLGAFVGGSAGSLTIATSSLFTGTTGQVPFFDGTNSLVGTSSLFIASNGNVGIGSTTPNARLTVVGEINAEGTTGNNVFNGTVNINGVRGINVSNINTGGNAGTSISVGTGGVTFQMVTAGSSYTGGVTGLAADTALLTTAYRNLRISNTSTSGARNISFFGNLSTGFTELARFNADSTGNFGVGTTSPWGQISASSTSSYPALAIQQQGSGAAAVLLGGNVGIGTTTPGSILSIQGVGNFTTATSTFTSTGGINLTAGCFAINGTCISGGGGGGSGTVNSGTAGQVAFYNTTGTAVSGTSTLTIATNERIGIGSTTPWALLSVNPTAAIGAAPMFAIGSSTRTSFLVDNAGRVGIGTMTPNFDLELSGTTGGLYQGLAISNPSGGGSAGTGIAFRSSSVSTGSINVFNDGSSANTFMAFSVRTANNTNEAMRILGSNASVGIGTTTPFERLTVAGNAFIGGNLTATGTVSFTALGSGLVSAANGVLSTVATSSLFTGTTGQVPVFTGTNALAGTSTLFITSNGNVGVGSTTPAETLGVSGQLLVQSAGNSILRVRDTEISLLGGSGITAADINLTAGPGVVNGGSVRITAGSPGIGSPGNILLDSNGGRVGVASTTPWGLFSINPTDAIGARPLFAIGSSTASNFVIANNGRVGIGTTTPGSILSIQGVGNFTTATSTFTSTGGINLTAGCFAINGTCISGGGGGGSGTVNSGTAGQVAFYNTTGTAVSGTSTLTIATNERIGIGSTTPWALLSVNPTAAIGAAPMFAIGSSTRTSFLVDNAGRVGIGTTSPWAALSASSTSANPTLAIQQRGTGAAAVLLGGRVGIGTTSPSATLAIQGNLPSADPYALFARGGDSLGAEPGGGFRFDGGSGESNFGAGGSFEFNGGVGGTLGGSGGSFTAQGGFGSFGGGIALTGGEGFDLTSSGEGGSVVLTGGRGNTGSFGNGFGGTVALVGGAGIGLDAFGGSVTLNGGTGSTTGNILLGNLRGRVGVGTSTPWAQLSASSTSANPALAIQQQGSGAAAVFLGGNVGIGTTSPWGLFSVNPTASIGANPILAIGSSTASNFVISNNGRVGIGTTTPGSILSIQGVGNFTTATSTLTSTGGINLTAGCFAINGTCISGGGGGGGSGTVNAGLAGQLAFYAADGTAVSGTSSIFITPDSRVGVGSTTPWGQFSTLSNSASPALAIQQQGSGAAAVFLGGNVGIGTTSPVARLSVEGRAFFDVGESNFDIFDSTNNISKFTVNGDSANVGIGSSTPMARLTVIGGGDNGSFPSFLVATTSTNSLSQHPLFIVTATTTGALDYARVAIGTTSPWGNAGLRDQFTVAGRMYSTWRHLSCDAAGSSAAGALSADVAGGCGDFTFDIDADGTAIFSQTQYPPFIELRAGSTNPSAGDGSAFTTGNRMAPASTSPVMEAWVQVPNRGGTPTTTPLFIVGMIDTNFGADTATMPTQGAYWIATSTANWKVVTRSANNVERLTDTGIATSSTNFQKLRVELTGNNAVFLLNGNVVAEHTTNIPSAVLRPVTLVSNFVGSGTSGTDPRLRVSLIRYWIDDPLEMVAADIAPLSEPEYDAIRGADIAEAYLTDDPSRFIPGVLVSNSTSTDYRVSMPPRRYDSELMGAIATSPHTVMGQETSSTVRVAIAGRVPVIVSLENGPIRRGDRITSSSVPGIGMRASRPGAIVGRAITGFDPEEEVGVCDEMLADELEAAGFDLPSDACVARVLVTLAPSFDMGIGSLVQDIDRLPGDVASAIADLANAAFTQGAQFTRFVAGQIVAQVATIGRLFTSALTILPDGDITVSAGENQISGRALLPAGETSIFVANTKAGEGAKVFVTPRTVLPAPLGVIEIRAGQGFLVRTMQAPTADVTFDYLIVNTYGGAESAAPAAAPEEVPPPIAPPVTSAPGGPTIQLNGAAALELPLGAGWTDPGASAVDAEDGDLTAQITVQGGVDTSTAGMYTITYRVTDSAGITAEASRLITVLMPSFGGPSEPPAPEPAPAPEPPPAEPAPAPEPTPAPEPPPAP